jgi:cation diffusion facilitator family transporter
MAASSSSKTVVYAAFFGNFLVALTKFGAAWWTGSAAMLSEAIHSLVDTSNQLLLLYGLNRAAQPPDQKHPLGHGRELYFWSFIVAVLLFALGAGVSIYEGVTRVRTPAPIDNASVNYIVLALSFVFEGISWRISQRAFRAAKGELGYWEAVRRSKDPPTFIVLFEDSAALIGIVIATFGTYAADTLQRPVFDGVASILIGLVLAATACLLARESKGLLIGERADPKIAASIETLAAAERGVTGANGVLTVQLAPDQIVAALSLQFDAALRTPQIEAAVDRLEQRVRERHPQVLALFVKPQTQGGFERNLRARYGNDGPHAKPSATDDEP